MIAGELEEDKLDVGTGVGWEDDLLKYLHRRYKLVEQVYTSITGMANL